jgi:hypothetical protein
VPGDLSWVLTSRLKGLGGAATNYQMRGGLCEVLPRALGSWLPRARPQSSGVPAENGKPRRMGSHGVGMGLAWGWHRAWGWHVVSMGLAWGCIWRAGMGWAWG